jgi:hypothetical protein
MGADRAGGLMMRYARFLIFSLLVTLLLTLVLRIFLGTMAFGLFLFLPLGYLWNNLKGPRKPSAPTGRPPGSEPIEPK